MSDIESLLFEDEFELSPEARFITEGNMTGDFPLTSNLNNTRKLLVMDMDGTIVDSDHVLHQATIDKLNELRSHGHIVCYATGRRDYDMEHVKYQHVCVDYVILNTGTIIRDIAADIDIYNVKVNPIAARTLIDTCLVNNWQLYVIYPGGYGLNIMTDGVYEYIEACGTKPMMYSSSSDFDLNNISGFMVSRDRKEIVSFIEDNKLALSCICSEPECFDITPLDIGKWSAVKALADKLSIPVSNIVTMGNWLNDKEMIEKAGTGVAVRTAIKELQDAADYVTVRTHDEDPVIEVAECFFGI